MGVYTCWPAGAPGIIATPVVEEGRRRWEGGKKVRMEGGRDGGREEERKEERQEKREKKKG